MERSDAKRASDILKNIEDKEIHISILKHAVAIRTPIYINVGGDDNELLTGDILISSDLVEAILYQLEVELSDLYEELNDL